jgi:hypothetical protein
MLHSEKLAIAAHLHVLLRRKTGRVTDTEWLAANAEYAAEIVRFARTRAQEPGLEDVAEWANRLEQAMAASPPPRRVSPAAAPVLRAVSTSPAPLLDPVAVSAPDSEFQKSGWGETGFADSRPPTPSRSAQDPGRYVGRLR